MIQMIPFSLKKLPHADLQAEFYRFCCKEGVPVSLEYKYENCRFDAVIHNKGFVVAIIEIKSYRSKKPAKLNTKQFAKYSQYGIPVFYVVRMKDIIPTIKSIKQILAVDFYLV